MSTEPYDAQESQASALWAIDEQLKLIADDLKRIADTLAYLAEVLP